jgi:hypothetical protein
MGSIDVIGHGLVRSGTWSLVRGGSVIWTGPISATPEDIVADAAIVSIEDFERISSAVKNRAREAA